ncbi:hypothetical protein AGDE_07158 [Angomonas deanei]|uniref:Uncharacterized protein n=1 Tax=Angomonas deanei TaxID=59799 RepID=A0A7G2CKK6_9TRYP|nr:hypothetical protein AGDE_07158 [Angomonas deanei]CAD2219103.1 hypothetical protein, conserved [Angomonas deanei]|eukprot:EPY35949.1 hypothetical protein AGDE_07158 [Angomonas deanei]
MFRYLGRVLLYDAKDLKSKMIFERAKRMKMKSGVAAHEINEREVAQEAGLVPPDCVSTEEFEENRKKLLRMLETQKLNRISRREAFLTWQAGQREKGAAQRLARQTRKQEKYKRHHYHSQKGKLLPLSFTDERDLDSPQNSVFSSNRLDSPHPRTASSVTDFLRRQRQ